MRTDFFRFCSGGRSNGGCFIFLMRHLSMVLGACLGVVVGGVVVANKYCGFASGWCQFFEGGGWMRMDFFL